MTYTAHVDASDELLIHGFARLTITDESGAEVDQLTVDDDTFEDEHDSGGFTWRHRVDDALANRGWRLPSPWAYNATTAIVEPRYCTQIEYEHDGSWQPIAPPEEAWGSPEEIAEWIIQNQNIIECDDEDNLSTWRIVIYDDDEHVGDDHHAVHITTIEDTTAKTLGNRADDESILYINGSRAATLPPLPDEPGDWTAWEAYADHLIGKDGWERTSADWYRDDDGSVWAIIRKVTDDGGAAVVTEAARLQALLDLRDYQRTAYRRDDLIRAAAAVGVSEAEIARTSGLSRMTVRKALGK